MNVDLSIGIDLGSDTIKIAFAYRNAGDIRYGKFDNKPLLTQIALPALAYYDMSAKKWLFGDQIGKDGQNSFITVVKIKSLISLLAPVELSSSWETNLRIGYENAEYYHNREHFPKFFFPARRKMLENFSEMVESGQTFVAKEYTPKLVCEQFFAYVQTIVQERIQELQTQTGLTFGDYKIALVHPSSMGEEYVDSISYLTEKVFGKEPHKVLSSNKALAIFAEHRKAIDRTDNFLVFDMAEEDITVARIGVNGNTIIIDGKDGHNEPCRLGGVDVDEAIVRQLEQSISDRETLGTPEAGNTGHIAEKGVYGKQYLLMKDIKKAKIIFSKYPEESNKFSKGVPVTLSRDVCIQRQLTRADIKASIGVATDSGIAKEIYEYILRELKRPLNYKVKKIFISGGLTETYSLMEYLRGKLAIDAPSIGVYTFEDEDAEGDCFHIRPFEDSVFAPAVGGAIASLTNKEIKVVLSLSYATWATPLNNSTKILKLFANRGDEIGNGRDFTIDLFLRGAGVAQGEELFSTYITESEISRREVPCDYCENHVVIGDASSQARRKAQQMIDLKTVSGGKTGFLIPLYEGSRVFIATDDSVDFAEGMRVDKDGRAHPIVVNTSLPDKYVTITDGGITKRVRAIDIDIATNLTDFATSQG